MNVYLNRNDRDSLPNNLPSSAEEQVDFVFFNQLPGATHAVDEYIYNRFGITRLFR